MIKCVLPSPLHSPRPQAQHTQRWRALLTAALALAPAAAFSHAGHDNTLGFAAGVLHPLTGLDHLVAMLAVGIWASQLGGKARLLLPLTFIGAMWVGALLARPDVDPASIEAVVAASVLALVAAVLWRLRPIMLVGALVVGCFAVFHGLAHAMEATGPLSAGYVGGMLLATAALHAAGLLLGTLAQRLQVFQAGV